MKWLIFFIPFLLFAQDMNPPLLQDPDPGQGPDAVSGPAFDAALLEHNDDKLGHEKDEIVGKTWRALMGGDELLFDQLITAWYLANNAQSNPEPILYSEEEIKDRYDQFWEDFSGPGSATNNAVALFDGTDGSTLKNSSVTINSSGQVFASSFIYTSDKKLKNDIKDIKDPLKKIQQIKGVTFKWKDGDRQNINYGFIAQEIEKNIPELVATNSGIKGVKYGEIIALLVEAIKAQQKQIEELKKK